MIYLRALAMTLISEEYLPALSQALQKMEFLMSLKLAGRLLPSSVFTNPSSRRLEVLALHGRLDAGDSMHGPFFLPNLGMLSISESSLKQDFIDKVATLPNLAEMELLGGSYSEAHLVSPAEGFQSLRKLKLANLMQLELAVVPAPESTLFTSSGCPLLKVERLQQVAAADPAENGILSGLEEPEFKDERPYIFSEIDQAAANDPTEDQMLVRRGVERFFQADTGDDPMEDQMLVRHGMEGLQDSEHFREDTADDPSKDEMLVRRGMEALQSRKEFQEDTADDRMEDQMLVRRGMEGLQDMEHRQEDDPTEDQMLVRHGM
ncbi:hypothetical protein CFC21_000193 [Triticum aestivum]|uniref:Uncharacterized protein n=1 Tax=Triticum aestivum TaxID=4565 RepID=A0A3B5XTG6_WHEAT|nr:hypothetical protein CFC21_000193 [Triticum aestivum]